MIQFITVSLEQIGIQVEKDLGHVAAGPGLRDVLRFFSGSESSGLGFTPTSAALVQSNTRLGNDV